MKEVWVLVLGFFTLLSAPGFSLVSDPRRLGGKVGSVVRNLRTEGGTLDQ